MKYCFAMALYFFMFTPHFVSAQSPVWVNSLLNELIYVLLPDIVTLLVGIAVLIFIIGLVRFITQSGDEKAVEEGKKFMVWGVIVLFVIVSIWGFVSLLQKIVGTTNNTTPPPPSTSNPL